MALFSSPNDNSGAHTAFLQQLSVQSPRTLPSTIPRLYVGRKKTASSWTTTWKAVSPFSPPKRATSDEYHLPDSNEVYHARYRVLQAFAFLNMILRECARLALPKSMRRTKQSPCSSCFLLVRPCPCPLAPRPRSLHHLDYSNDHSRLVRWSICGQVQPSSSCHG